MHGALLSNGQITGSLFTTVLITVPSTVLVVIIGALAGYAFLAFGTLMLKWINPITTGVQVQRRIESWTSGKKYVKRYKPVPMSRISVELQRAVIAAEDAKFVDHEGFDWEGIQKAIEKNQRKGRVVAGGSTISQQLAKNLFLSPRKSMLRKAEEAAITVMIEVVWSKRRILEVYLNMIEWGNGVLGAEAAARHYYGVSAERLGPVQAAKLAGMVPNPRLYDRNRNAPGLARALHNLVSNALERRELRTTVQRLQRDLQQPRHLRRIVVALQHLCPLPGGRHGRRFLLSTDGGSSEHDTRQDSDEPRVLHPSPPAKDHHSVIIACPGSTRRSDA